MWLYRAQKSSTCATKKDKHDGKDCYGCKDDSSDGDGKTVVNVMISRWFSSHCFVLSFLKNHNVHAFWKDEKASEVMKSNALDHQTISALSCLWPGDQVGLAEILSFFLDQISSIKFKTCILYQSVMRRKKQEFELKTRDLHLWSFMSGFWPWPLFLPGEDVWSSALDCQAPPRTLPLLQSHPPRLSSPPLPPGGR